MPFGPKKVEISGRTPSSGASKGFAPIKINMELDLQSVQYLGSMCTAQLHSLDETLRPPTPPQLGSYTRALLPIDKQR